MNAMEGDQYFLVRLATKLFRETKSGKYKKTRNKKGQVVLSIFLFVLVTTFYLSGLVSLVGLLGNTFVISIIASSRRRGQRSNVQLFLLHLAISDLLVCIVCIPLTLWVNFYYPDEDKSGANGVCKLARFVQVS